VSPSSPISRNGRTVLAGKPQHSLASAQDFYRDLKERMAKYRRPPEALKIMPGLNAIVGRTAKEAEEKHRFLQSKIHPDVGLELLSNAVGGFDLSEYDSDGPLPENPGALRHAQRPDLDAQCASLGA
jgi:alkanesulfonate monooxygenase SsuD/methylene tetrahydromethanopterin reductase-like flavin-dependent oxidoreductase (luciferase family)